MHGHHHHRMSAPPAPKGPVKHHYGSGKHTTKVVLVLIVCLVVNFAWSCAGVQQHP